MSDVVDPIHVITSLVVDKNSIEASVSPLPCAETDNEENTSFVSHPNSGVTISMLYSKTWFFNCKKGLSRYTKHE